MYQTCHCVVTCNRGLNNGLNTESSKVSIKGILGTFLWDDQDQWSEITPIILGQMNQWILVQSGFIGSFDLPWSEWSQITDPDPDHHKGTHPLTLSWMILLFCEDPVVGSLTALECALNGFNKLCYMAEEVFGEDVFSSGRKEGKQNENLSGKKMTLSYHNVSLQLSPLRTCHWKVCLTCFFFVPTLFYSAAAIFLSQNIVLLNEPKVKLCLLLCLYSDLNAYKDIRRQSTVEVLHIHHHSFTKT